MSQGGFIDVGANNPDIATQYDGNAGSAIPQLNILNVVGSGGTTVTGSGNTLTINSTGISTPISVADGGTGRSSHTEYAVLCGGTTTTAAQQSIASVGTSGQVLTSNGAAALPTFQAVAAASPGAAFNLLQGQTDCWFPLSLIYPTTLNVTSNRLELLPIFFHKEITLSSVAVSVVGGVAGSTARLGLYEQSTSTGNFTLVTDFGVVSTATSSTTPSTAATDVLDPSKLYWFAFVCDENGGGVTIRGAGNLSPISLFYTTSELRSFYKNSVGIGALAASYNLTDFTVNAASSYAVVLVKGSYT